MVKISFTLQELKESCLTLKSKNKFSPGFDKMTPEAAEIWLGVNGEKLCKQLNNGKYDVMPAIGFNVAKFNGSFRRFTKLTAIDTIVQTSALDKLSPFCEDIFSDTSYAYRKGYSVGSALQKYCEYASEYMFAAKTDLKACFDCIDFDILEKALYVLFKDKKTVRLLMSFAEMQVIEDGRINERKKGILQGAPISGLLCNIYLNILDKKLEEMNIPFIRYGDDIVIFAQSKMEAETRHDFVCSFLRDELLLTVNNEKSYVDSSESLVFLGHKFFRDKGGKVTTGVSEKSVAVYYDWYTTRPGNHRRSIDILSDGILRQKDYSAIFDSATGKTDIPIGSLERINIFSNVIFDNRFLELAMNSGIYVNIFKRDYSYIGRFTPAAHFKDTGVIFEQLQAYANSAERLTLAKEFDLASVHNLRLNIRYYNKQRENDCYGRVLNSIDMLFEEMKACEEYERLLLIEAQIRGLYYSCFDSFITNDAFRFEKRSKLPPTNEVNSMLSFGNVVLYNYIATCIYKSALDIRVGFLHATNRREESLNLDIAEIFRPLIIDRVVFTLINRRSIGLKHFENTENGGVYLNEEGKRIFLKEFYDKLNSTLSMGDKTVSYSTLITGEIQKLVRRFRKGEKYKAYRQVR